MCLGLGDLGMDGEGESSSCVVIEIEDLMTDVAGKVRDETYLIQHLHRISTLTNKLYINVFHTACKDIWSESTCG